MINAVSRKGVCPFHQFYACRKQLESNGYRIIRTFEVNHEGKLYVHYDYEKVSSVARTVMFSQ